MRKKHISIVAAFAMSAAGLFAADAPAATSKDTKSMQEVKTVAYGDDSDRHYSNGSSHGEHFNDTYDKIKGTTITPNAGPVVSGGCDLFLSADFIYWYSTITSKSVVGEINTRTPDEGTSGSERFKTPNSMDPGFKVAAGLDLKYDGWDTLAEYTWLHAKDAKYGTGNLTTNYIYAYNSRMNSFHNVEHEAVKTDWSMHFNVIDWALGRNFFVSPKLALRPHFGLKGSWQTHRYHYHFEGTDYLDENDTVVTQVGNASVRNKVSYWGIGIRAGLDTSWMFSRNWSLFGNLAMSPMWNTFKSKLNVTETDVVDDRSGEFDLSGTLFEHATMKEIQHLLGMVFEFQLGIRWDYYFSDSDYRVRLQAAWEEQVWDNFDHFITHSFYHPLTLQGLTVKFRFDF